MSFKMNGSPATTGGIQGTSSHASALKKVEAPTKMYDSPAQSHEKGHKGAEYILATAEEKKMKRAEKGEMLRGDAEIFANIGITKKSSDRTELSDRKENKRNKLINKRTKLKDKGKEKETSGKLRRTQNKINKLDGSKVRHKKGFLGLGKYKKVKKD